MSTEPSSCFYKLWGVVGEDFDQPALDQLMAACGLPVAAGAALMPDAHVGYGLPIGGVLATRNAVIPYAVGVDIACRMKLSVLDLPASTLEKKHTRDQLASAIEDQTSFGIGAEFPRRREHAVMDMDWDVSPVTRRLKDKAWAQLGTSGSGNHFVEFGTLTVLPNAPRGIDQKSEGRTRGLTWSPGRTWRCSAIREAAARGRRCASTTPIWRWESGVTSPARSGTWRGWTWIRRRGVSTGTR